MAVNKEWFPKYPPGLRKALGMDREKPQLEVLPKDPTPVKSAMPVTVFYWCRVCQQKTPSSETKSCDCGVIMCNTCWQEWEDTCPICETNLKCLD